MKKMNKAVGMKNRFTMDGISTDISEDRVEERDTDLNEEEDIRLDSIREEHWRGFAEEVDNKKKIHSLRWDV